MNNKYLVFSIGSVVVMFLIIGASLLFRYESCRDFSETQLLIDGSTYKVALADEGVEQNRGLAGCRSIPEKSGMYFPYERPQVVAFWMKKMEIPIDIIWIADNKVIGIEANVPLVDTYMVDPPKYRPPRPITAVLEVGSGKAAEYGIKVGSTVLVTPAR